MNEGEILRMNLSDYRPLAIIPNGGILVWNVSYIGETEKTIDPLSENDIQWHITDSGLRENSNIGSVVLSSFTSENYDASKTVAENVESRQKYVYSPGGMVPFNIIFEAGENYLMVYAKRI